MININSAVVIAQMFFKGIKRINNTNSLHDICYEDKNGLHMSILLR